MAQCRPNLLGPRDKTRSEAEISQEPFLLGCHSFCERQLGDVSCDHAPGSCLRAVEAMLQDMIQRTGRHSCILFDLLLWLLRFRSSPDAKTRALIDLVTEVQVPEARHEVPVPAELRLDSARKAARDVEELDLCRRSLGLAIEQWVCQQDSSL